MSGALLQGELGEERARRCPGGELLDAGRDGEPEVLDQLHPRVGGQVQVERLGAQAGVGEGEPLELGVLGGDVGDRAARSRR